MDWARHFVQADVVDLLESYRYNVFFNIPFLCFEYSIANKAHIYVMLSVSASKDPNCLDESSLVQADGSNLSEEEQELLKVYHHSFDDERVDLDLIMHVLYNICQSSESGTVSWVHEMC